MIVARSSLQIQQNPAHIGGVELGTVLPEFRGGRLRFCGIRNKRRLPFPGGNTTVVNILLLDGLHNIVKWQHNPDSCV